MTSPSLRHTARIAIATAVLGLGISHCRLDEHLGKAPGAGDAGADELFLSSCAAGEYRCVEGVARACDGAGGLSEEGRDCAAEGMTCSELFGCVTCFPGEGSCSEGIGSACRADGSGFDEFECDPLQGMRCEPDGCKGSCAPAELADSYVGCDYYPTVTLNPVWSGFRFAAAVGNAGSDAAHLTITRQGEVVETATVAPGQATVIELPWVTELKGGDEDACRRTPPPGRTHLVKGGAYRLRSDQPVTVYQLSPLTFALSPIPDGCPRRIDCGSLPTSEDPEDPLDPANVLRSRFESEGCLSFTNDASLLLPATTFTGTYTTLSWPSRAATAGFVAITAAHDDTEVQIAGAGAFAAGAGIDERGEGVLRLDRGDVLQLVAAHDADDPTFGADISGTRVQASRPVQVIAGHSCANVPEATTQACDHLESAMLPAETLGKDYLVTYPAARASRSGQLVRIAAVEEETRIDFEGFEPPAVDPPRCADGCLLGPDDGPITLSPASEGSGRYGILEDFRITADKPILVAQYMLGQEAVDSGSGDPSLSIAVPTAQFRDNYIFTASKTYDVNFVNVIARSGSTVTLDGVAMAADEFEPIGATGYSVARHELEGEAETHRIESAQPFGILVYGYGTFTSYMYPGGLDLKKLSPPIIY